MNISFFWKFLIFCSLTNCSTTATKDPGCVVEFQSDAYKNKSFYLASHYGKYQTLLDSVSADSSGKLTFKKTDNSNNCSRHSK